MADYYTNIAKGKYDLVSAGEVCTIATAQNLGIYDKKNYFNSSYAKETKTYAPARDESVHTSELCAQTDNAKSARPLCMSQHKFGFVRKRGYPDKCITVDCPTGFVEERSGVCKKPLEDAKLLQRSKCDERWYDWFMIPNYHAGNKYFEQGPGQCYAPCQPGHIPAYAQDPVDGANMDFTSKDDMTKCVPRTDYFGGKYLNGSEYCPIAWIYRMNATPDYFKGKTKEEIEKVLVETGGQRSAAMNKLEAELDSQSQELSKQAATMFEEVTLDDEAMASACKQQNTSERLQEAYDICKQVKDDDSAFARKLEEQAGDDEVRQQQKLNVLKHACNSLFCNQDIDPYVADSIGKDPLCFDLSKAGDVLAAEEAEKLPPDADEGARAIRKSIGYSFIIIFVGIIGVMAIFATTRFIWPKVVRPIVRFVKRILTGWKSGALNDAVSDQIDAIGKPRVR